MYEEATVVVSDYNHIFQDWVPDHCGHWDAAHDPCNDPPSDKVDDGQQAIVTAHHQQVP